MINSIKIANALIRLSPVAAASSADFIAAAAQRLPGLGFGLHVAEDRVVLPHRRMDGAGTAIATENGSLKHIEVCVSAADKRESSEMVEACCAAYDEHLARIGTCRVTGMVIATAQIDQSALGPPLRHGTLDLAPRGCETERVIQFQWDEEESTMTFLMQTEREGIQTIKDAINYLHDCREMLVQATAPACLAWLEQVIDLEWPERTNDERPRIEAPNKV